VNVFAWLTGKAGPVLAAFVAGCMVAALVQQWRLGVTLAQAETALAVAHRQHEADRRTVAVEAASAASAAAQETARSAADVAALETRFREEQHEARKTMDALRTDVRSGAVRLRVAVAGCTAAAGGGDVSGTGPAPGGTDGAGTAGLDAAAAGDLLGIAGDGDAAIRKLAALQDYAREAQRVCGVTAGR
jgi:hypothetical protein